MPRYQAPIRIITRKGLPSDTVLNNGETVDISSQDHTVTQGYTVMLYVGTGGTVKVKMIDATDLTFTNVISGTFLPLCVTKIYRTGTTASGMVALW